MILLTILGQFSLSYGQDEYLIIEVASSKIESYLGKSCYTQNTIKEIDGYIYYFNFNADSSYIRINALTNSQFDCCGGSEYVVKREMNSEQNYLRCIALDQGGTIVDSKLSWRRLIIGDFEIVYNMIPYTNLLVMDNIFDSIKLELSDSCP